MANRGSVNRASMKQNNRLSMSALSVKERMALWKARDTNTPNSSGLLPSTGTAQTLSPKQTSSVPAIEKSVTSETQKSNQMQQMRKISEDGEEGDMSVDELMKALQSQGVETHQNGYYLARTPNLNKGHSFTHQEREEYGLRGLYPAGNPLSLQVKVQISMEQLRLKSSPLEKYNYLSSIQDADETLFYSMFIENISEILPLLYTPIIGEVCTEWSKIFRHSPRGLYLSSNDKNFVRPILNNFPNKDIKLILITDGERVLNLGDVGVNAMGLCISKLTLFTAFGGIDPSACLPIHIDFGTDNEKLLQDPFYMGLKQKRVRGKEFDALINEVIEACQDAYGRNVVFQFEAMSEINTSNIMSKYKNISTCFSDDVRGSNIYIFPGIALAAIASGASSLNENDFVVAATSLSSQIPDDRMAQGVPRIENIRNVSLNIAVAVTTNIIQSGRASPEVSQELISYPSIVEQCQWMMYEPAYDY